MKARDAIGLAFAMMGALILTACVPVAGTSPAAPSPTAVVETVQPSAPTALPASETDAPESETPVGIANPASVNCTKEGGTLSIEKRGDGGEFGVCIFEDNRQCEEWALLRGDCMVGGIKVTGFVTPAARYCAITGGAYAVIGESGTESEMGICTLPNGVECDVWDYYNGTCAS